MAFSIRFPEDLDRRLDALATQTGRTKAFYVNAAIAECIDELEDVYLAEKRLEDIRAGRSKPVALDEVMKRYGLAD
jgi:RHH-type transcriptional regulator, rel operon repressor / antitoxin RelB